MYTFIDKEYEVLSKPLTKEEMLKSVNKDNYVEGVIQTSLSNLINGDYENFLDYISEALIDSPCLMDIQYEIVGCDKHDIVLLLVSGQVDIEIEDLDEEEE